MTWTNANQSIRPVGVCATYQRDEKIIMMMSQWKLNDGKDISSWRYKTVQTTAIVRTILKAREPRYNKQQTQGKICGDREIKDDFRSVLRTLESLFAFFYFVSCKTSKNVNISQLLAWKFQNNRHYGCEARWKLYALFFLISLDETTSQL